MKFRIIKNRVGKYQPQMRQYFIWCNFWEDDVFLLQFNDFEKAELCIHEYIECLKNNKQSVSVIKEYNYE